MCTTTPVNSLPIHSDPEIMSGVPVFRGTRFITPIDPHGDGVRDRVKDVDLAVLGKQELAIAVYSDAQQVGTDGVRNLGTGVRVDFVQIIATFACDIDLAVRTPANTIAPCEALRGT